MTQSFLDFPTIDWLNDSEWVFAPAQDRSRKGMESVLRVAKDLFLNQGYDETTITEISKQSGVSVGSIYYRFPDKQAILCALLEIYRRNRYQQMLQLTQRDLWQDKTPLDILEFHVEVIISSTNRDAAILRLIERQKMISPAIRDMQVAWDEEICALFMELYTPHSATFISDDLSRSVAYVHNIIRGSALWSILAIPPSGHFLDVSSDDYRVEALTMAARYLGLNIAP